MNITIFYPDGTSKTRPMTEQEIATVEAEKQALIDDAWTNLRNERNALLTNSDWTVLADSPTPTAAWKAYRQALRDLPANTTDPTAPDWPTPPS
jgi:hypothetical protein